MREENHVMSRQDPVGAEMASPWRPAPGLSDGAADGAAADQTLLQLREMLQQEQARRAQLEAEVADAQRRLAVLRAELSDSQDGERRSRHLALHDHLTTLPNRGYFLQRLSEVLNQSPPAQSVAVLFLDLDGFKAINDTHGHAAGDQLLSIVAVRLVRTIRAQDMVGRLGGDEFACLLCDVPGREQLIRLAEKVFAAVSDPVRMGALLVRVQPSIGIAELDATGITPELLLSRADAAMYAAKRARAGVVFYDPERISLLNESERRS